VKIHSTDIGEISTQSCTATLGLVKIGVMKGMLYLQASTKFCLLFLHSSPYSTHFGTGKSPMMESFMKIGAVKFTFKGINEFISALSTFGPGYLSRYSDYVIGWTVRESIPVGTRFSAPVETDPGVHPASHTMGTGFLPGVKRPGRGHGHPPHLAPRLKKEYSCTSTPF
jgi:hypothetical protein